jgi:small GTP-binding protein
LTKNNIVRKKTNLLASIIFLIRFLPVLIMGANASTHNIKVLLVGLSDAGKTTLLYRMKLKQKASEFSTTTGFNFEQIEIPGSTTKLAIWDLAGTLERQRFWRFFYEAVRVDVVLFVINLDKKKQLAEASKLFRFLRNEERLRQALKIVILNSDDENKDEHAKATHEDVEMALGIVKENPHERILAVNVLTGVGLDSLFQAIQEYYC